MKVGLIQQKNTADRAANIEKLKVNIRKAAREGAELVVLQELHNGLYFCQTEDTSMFDLAETIPGPSTEIFGALAKELGIAFVTINRWENGVSHPNKLKEYKFNEFCKTNHIEFEE